MFEEEKTDRYVKNSAFLFRKINNEISDPSQKKNLHFIFPSCSQILKSHTLLKREPSATGEYFLTIVAIS